MPGFILAGASLLGISPLRLIGYAVVAASVVIGGFAIRHHFVSEGYRNAISAVKKQDDRAVAAAEKVQRRADECSGNSWWDVISQSCKLENSK